MWTSFENNPDVTTLMKTPVKLLKIATDLRIVVLGTTLVKMGNAIRPESGEEVIDGQVVSLLRVW